MVVFVIPAKPITNTVYNTVCFNMERCIYSLVFAHLRDEHYKNAEINNDAIQFCFNL